MGAFFWSLFGGSGLNLPELDNKPCHHCHKKIPALYTEKKNKKGEIVRVRDRSNRIDCDESKRGLSKLVTYHKECWRSLIRG